MTLNNKYSFWLKDPKVLYEDQKYLEFIPTSKMSRADQLNAITRFCIYFLILAAATQKSDGWIQFPIVVMILCIILYYVFESDTEGMTKELSRLKDITIDDNDDNKEKIIIETGGYDSNGKLRLGKYR